MQMYTIKSYKEINNGYIEELDDTQLSYLVSSLTFVVIIAAIISIYVIIRFRLKRNIYNLTVLKESNSKLDNLIWFLNLTIRERHLAQFDDPEELKIN
jgi:hypothetical protein